ncbi:MAG: hypothetical protein methR_P1872 [Methyloprofundus sp.]|nr:MAG: hypothetical protein methR_P1872 [Methyloprofundus sp.]
METIIYGLGYFVTGLLAIYVFFWVLYQILNLEAEPVIQAEDMPKLKPLPIPTNKQKTIFHKLAIFLIDVRKWEVVEDWHYVLNDETTFVIPSGYQFDGASIPRIFWAILSPTGILLIPGLLHDYAYEHDQLMQLNSKGSLVPYEKNAGKDFWDNLFRKIGNKVNGIYFINTIAWFAVSKFGGSTWNEYRK